VQVMCDVFMTSSDRKVSQILNICARAFFDISDRKVCQELEICHFF